MRYLTVKISRYSTDELREHIWIFITIDGKIYLDEYEMLERESKRHRKKLAKYYSRLSVRKSTIGIEDCPMSYCLINDMREEFRRKLDAMPFDYPAEHIQSYL